jgi:hypothetical protein
MKKVDLTGKTSKITQHIDGHWKPWAKDQYLVCCNCGFVHDVQTKIDKRGIIWTRWTIMGVLKEEKKRKKGTR